MPGWVKKLCLTVLVAFVVFFIVTRPDTAAGFVHGVADAGQSVINFFEALATGS
ncbi:MAG: hypothetical protein LBL92_05520 [Propionibacteriaceae bacterium]|nr:hypothetical protein [Propionibacteriaceae bacterium]